MATVFREGKRSSPRFGVSFHDLKGQRRFWYRVGPDKATAKAVARRIDTLKSRRLSDESLRPEMVQWLEQLPTNLRDKLVQAGLVDSQRAAAGQAIDEHLAQFEESLRAKGITPKRIRQVINRTQRVLEAARVATLSEITPARVEHVLTEIRNQDDVTSRTRSFYLASVKQFCRWAVRNGLMASNPLEHLSVKLAGDVKKRRRPLTVEETRRLVTTTADGPVRHGTSGPERALIYVFTAETGCRAGEVAALSAGDFDVSTDHGSVTVQSGTTKNRRERSVLLSESLSALIRKHLAGKLPTAPAFKTPRVDAFAKMLRKDCREAGIEIRDASGREVDFHALRVTSASLLVASGVDVKLAQQRLGHHDSSLTLNVYAMTYREAEVDAMRKMPDLTAKPTTEQARSTGTDDCPASSDEASKPVKGAQQKAQQKRSISVRSGSSSCATEGGVPEDAEECKSLKNQKDSASIHSDSSSFIKAGGRTRTCDLRFTKPPLCH